MNCPQILGAIRVAAPGPARFDLVPHVNAPVADLTLPAGHVLVDYLKDTDLRHAA